MEKLEKSVKMLDQVQKNQHKRVEQADEWLRDETRQRQQECDQQVKPVRTPVAILGSLGVCIYVPASRHWLISYSPIHLT